jgi:hypothetical protein
MRVPAPSELFPRPACHAEGRGFEPLHPLLRKPRKRGVLVEEERPYSRTLPPGSQEKVRNHPPIPVEGRHSERPEESPNLERRSCAELSALAPFVRSWSREYVYPFSVPPSAKLERRVEVAKLNCVQVPLGRQRDPARPPEAARRSPYRYRFRSSVLPRPSRRLPLRFERGGRALGVPAWTEVRLSQETGTEPETEPRRRTLDEYPSVE